MAQVVMVHGISHQEDAADTIRAEWLPALAGGVRNAGFEAIADRLSPDGRVTDRFDVRVAFYGLIFREPGRQGGEEGELSPESREIANDLAEAYLLRAHQARNEELQRSGEEELAALGLLEGGESQGVRAVQRQLLNRLLKLPWAGQLGMPVATWWNRHLHQVTRYLTDEEVRKAAQQKVLELLDETTQVLVAHSLGSVVAYEACFQLTRPLPLLVTIGSPLGLAKVVYERLRPQPPAFPPHVRSWVNVADRNDIVAAEPALGRFFGDVPDGARFDSEWMVHNGRDPHSAKAYLTAVEVGRPVGQTLTV